MFFRWSNSTGYHLAHSIYRATDTILMGIALTMLSNATNTVVFSKDGDFLICSRTILLTKITPKDSIGLINRHKVHLKKWNESLIGCN